MLLNLNIAMALKSTGKPSVAEEAYQSPYKALVAGTDAFADEYYASLLITWCLAVPNALGYVVILLFAGLTKVPEVVRGVDDAANGRSAFVAVAGGGSSSGTSSPSKARDCGALLLPLGVAAVTLCFGAMRDAAYPEHAGLGHMFRETFYGQMLALVNVLALLVGMRRLVVVASTPTSRCWCIVFDAAWALRGEAALCFFAIQGFRNGAFFTLMLLDVASISGTVQSLVKSVTTPGFQLVVVAYCFVVIALIYSAFALEYFEDYFVFDPDAHDESRGCHSVIACFWLIMYHGVPAGSLEPVLDVQDNSDNSFIFRTFFELVFFILVGIILFNVITGLMVDTFTSLREEAALRVDNLTNECFVCGFTRSAYNDLGMARPTFDEHKSPRGHCPWNYLYFVQYLNAKDETEFSGVETYVNAMLLDKSVEWVPERTSFAVQHFGLQREESEATVERLVTDVSNRLDAGLRHLTKKIDRIEHRIAHIDAATRV